MRLRTIFTFGAACFFFACVPGSPVYLGGGFATFNGMLYALEDMEPIANAEVCLFSADTSCVRTKQDGSYEVFATSEGATDVRFRITGARPAVVTGIEVVFDEFYEVNCVLSTRMTLSTESGSCREDR